jgi:UDP-glucose 4-epimerase
MRVAVTGGTGFVGAHSVRALVDDGHDVRVLTTRPDAARATLDALGVDPDAHALVPGDVRDAEAVEALLADSDALLHAAGVVGVDDRDERAMWEVNAQATASVLTRAVGLGLDPVVHVASYSALAPCPDPVMGPDSPTTGGRSAYGRTKAAGDRVARGLQAAGAPVVITYPSSVVGPAAGARRGITAEGWAPLLRMGASVTFEGGMAVVDVRDLARVHAAAMAPGRGPRRYLCGGTMARFDEILDHIAEAHGRPIRRVRLPGPVLRGLGRAADVAGKVLPLPPSFSHEAAVLLTAATPTDDTLVREELGVHWRPLGETFRDALGTAHPDTDPTDPTQRRTAAP